MREHGTGEGNLGLGEGETLLQVGVGLVMQCCLKKDVEVKGRLRHLERGPSRHRESECRDPGAGRPNCCSPKDATPIVSSRTVGSEGYACSGVWVEGFLKK